MAKRSRTTLGFDRRYEFALYPRDKSTADNKARKGALWDQARTCVHLWNALLELCELCREMRVWWFDPSAGGPIFMDASGTLHVLSLADILERRIGKTAFLYRHSGGVTGLMRTRAAKIGQDISRYEQRVGRPSGIGMGYWISACRGSIYQLASTSTWVPRRQADKLHAAFEAYKRRYKEYLAKPEKLATDKQAFMDRTGRAPTIHELSGYPRYKSLRDADSIPYRHKALIRRSGGSGCSLEQNKEHHPEKSWWLTLQGIPERIWARGTVPLPVHDWTHGGTRPLPDQETALKEWKARGDDEKYLNDWNDADVRFHDGKWHISIAAEIDGRREKVLRGKPLVVRFGLIACLAEVNGVRTTPEGLEYAHRLEENAAKTQKLRDDKFPRNRRWSDDERQEYNRLSGLIAKLKAKAARIRSNVLHIWSKRLVETASMITIIKTRIKENTQTPRGNETNWGANTAKVSTLNRNILSFAPAMAMQMIEYKAREHGIPCTSAKDDTPEIAAGGEAVENGKLVRRVRRIIKRRKETEHEQSQY